MSEKALSRLLMTRMKPHGHFDRIENMTGVGMPDVTFCVRGVEGFIENKWRAGWPAKTEGVVTLDHFTSVQRLWIQRRCAAGGRVYVLLEVERPSPTYLLLPGYEASNGLGLTWTRLQTVQTALVAGVGAFPTERLIRALITGKPVA